MKRILTVATAILLSATSAIAETNIMFIVDSSGSMKETAGEQTRMEAAKDVLGKTLSEMPDNVNLGLLAYGHRNAKDCTDIEVISEIGKADATALQKTVAGLTAKGETPIAESLMRAAAEFKDSGEGTTNKIILVTDGLEECKGDPCAAAQAIKEQRVDVAVDVVGFTFGAEEAKAVQCIADATGGQIYTAANAKDLTTALQKAAAPKQTLIFEEDFDSVDSVAVNWTINNEDDETYIIEDGELIFVAGKKDLETSPYYPSTFTMNKDLPDGDWVMNVTFTPENGQYTDFGIIFGDIANTEKVKTMLAGSKTEYASKVLGGFWLNNKGKNTKEWNSVSNVYNDSWTGAAERFATTEKFEMQISHVGREYIMKMRGADQPDGEWAAIASIGVIKPFKKANLAIGTNNNNHSGSSTFKVDKVSLYKIGE